MGIRKTLTPANLVLWGAELLLGVAGLVWVFRRRDPVPVRE
jgi:LPXTG-motif cell wall-anchored protein